MRQSLSEAPPELLPTLRKGRDQQYLGARVPSSLCVLQDTSG